MAVQNNLVQNARIRSVMTVGAVVLVSMVALLQGCSKTSEPAPAPAQPAAAAPTTGAVQGVVMGQRGKKALPGQVVVLCELTSETTCNLSAALSATSGDDGSFEIRKVAPGHYTVAHAPASEKLKSKLKDSGLDFGVRACCEGPAMAVDLMSGTRLDIDAHGKPKNIHGALRDTASGLRFEYRTGKLASLDVQAGATAKAEVSAWGQ